MIQNIPREKVLEVVSLGPTVPAKIVKQVGGDTMIIGAILSTIISTGKIKVSSLKVGGSPLYYIPEHESKLEEYVDHLNEKDRRTYLLIKDQKVLMDESQDALIRVSIKNIRDFAKPFYLNGNSGDKILFWRFYNVPLDQAELIAQKVLSDKSKIQSSSQSSNIINAVQIKEEFVVPVESNVSLETKSEIKNNVPNSSQLNPEVPKELSIDTHETHSVLDKDKQESHKSHADHHKETHPKEHKAHHEVKHREPKPHVEKIKKEKPIVDPNKKEFYELILNFISSVGLDILSKEKIKKSEYNLILKNHNTNEYIYCKAKDKSIITDADLAPALIFAQNKKMPCLFLSTGELSQKTQVMMNNEFASLMFKKI